MFSTWTPANLPLTIRISAKDNYAIDRLFFSGPEEGRRELLVTITNQGHAVAFDTQSNPMPAGDKQSNYEQTRQGTPVRRGTRDSEKTIKLCSLDVDSSRVLFTGRI